jgi:hypothetical protein
MGPDASTGPPRPSVECRFETNRLAKDFQARAYEELLPLIRRCPSGTAAAAQAEVAWAESQRVQAKGVAA